MTNLKVVAGPGGFLGEILSEKAAPAEKAASVDRLGKILAEKTAAEKLFAENEATLVRVDEFDRAVAAVRSEVQGLADRETAALREWTLAGCQGPAPAPLTEERAAAVQRLVEAEAAAEPGPRTRAEIEIQNHELSARISQIVIAFEEGVLHALEAELFRRSEALRKSLVVARSNLAAVLGYRAVLYAHADDLERKGRNDERMAILHRLARLEIPGTAVSVTDDELQAARTVALRYEGQLRAGQVR